MKRTLKYLDTLLTYLVIFIDNIIKYDYYVGDKEFGMYNVITITVLKNTPFATNFSIALASYCTNRISLELQLTLFRKLSSSINIKIPFKC